MSEKTIAISAKNISLSYVKRVGFFRTRRFYPIKDVSIDIYKGETLAIIGKNGAGKSSLLRVLANIIESDSGSIIYGTERISLLTMQLGFFPHLTGRENAILGGLLYGVSKKIMVSRIDEIIEYSGLNEFFDEPLHTYSSGMRARLAFSVANIADPDVMILDEMLGVGDESFRKKSKKTMKEKISSNKTVILVSHNLQFLETIADRVMWLDGGCVRAIGVPKDIIGMYAESV